MLEEGPLDVSVDLLGRKLADFVERDRDALHPKHVETRLDEIFRKQIIDAANEIGRAQDLPGLERAQRAHVVRARGEEWPLVLPLPFREQLGFALEAEQHERRRALRMDQVAAGLRELLDQGLIGRSRALEFIRRAFAYIEEQWNNADAFGQHADQLFEPARPQRRLDAADNAAPTGECHGGLLRFRSRCANSPAAPSR